jgi:pimeloyl-ACP methyl ester carboxylesterase
VTAHDHFRGGHGTPLVLLHPAVTTWRMWSPVLPTLTLHHDVFAPTLPGHHGGPPGPAELTFSGLADAIEQQLDDAGIGRAHLAGNSLGAAATLELARRGRALSATAISPPGAWGTRLDRLLLEVKLVTAVQVASVPLPRVPSRVPALRRLGLTAIMRHGDRVPREEIDHLLAGRCHSARFVARLINGLRAEGHTQAPFAPAPCPTLVAWPSHDLVLPWRRYGAPLQALLPDARFTRLPGVGHLPMYDDPELVARTILSMSLPAASAAETAV